MTQQFQSPAAAQPPEPAVVEWGDERPGLLDRLIDVRGWHPAVPWVFAGLGAIALFGSLVGEWQVVEQSFIQDVPDGVGETQSFGLGYMLVWGVGWLVGATLLAVCCGLALAGQSPLRRHARTIGLTVAAVQVGILLGAAVSLDNESLFAGGPESSMEITLGRGVYAAFASVLLISVALYLARTRPTRWRQLAAEPVAVDGPADLVVGPAEPDVRPTDTLQG